MDSDLYRELKALAPDMARAAQCVYDAWDASDEYDEYAGGGICQDIADAVLGVILGAVDGVEAGTVSASCGEQHVWVIAYRGSEAYSVDVPYSLYESGAGYSWEKVPGVEFSAGHVSIDPMSVADARDAMEYEG